MNKQDKAYEYLMKSNKLLPDNFETLANLGKVLFFMGKFKDSKDFCKRAIQKKQDSETQNILGACLMSLEEYNDALQIFLDLYDKNPNNITIMLNITKCYYNLKDYDNALIIANKILDILPECGDAQKIIEQIEDINDHSNYVVRLNSKDVALPLYVRNRKDGDKIDVKGMEGRKKVSDIFINEKIKTSDRKLWPIVLDSKDNIVWIPGIKKSKFDKKPTEEYDIILRYY